MYFPPYSIFPTNSHPRSALFGSSGKPDMHTGSFQIRKMVQGGWRPFPMSITVTIQIRHHAHRSTEKPASHMGLLFQTQPMFSVGFLRWYIRKMVVEEKTKPYFFRAVTLFDWSTLQPTLLAISIKKWHLIMAHKLELQILTWEDPWDLRLLPGEGRSWEGEEWNDYSKSSSKVCSSNRAIHA